MILFLCSLGAELKENTPRAQYKITLPNHTCYDELTNGRVCIKKKPGFLHKQKFKTRIFGLNVDTLNSSNPFHRKASRTILITKPYFDAVKTDAIFCQ